MKHAHHPTSTITYDYYFITIDKNTDIVIIINKCKKLKQFKTRWKDDMVNSDN